MAEIKKYLDLLGAEKLVDLVKAEDVKVKEAANAYADSLSKNYDASGAAATAEANAKAHADQKVGELADGAVKANTEAIAKLNGADTEEGSVAKAVKDAKDALQANINGVDAKTDKNAEDIAAINNAETGILKTAKDYTDTEVAKVQSAVDELGDYVGEIPVVEGEETPATIVAYVQKKTSGIATSDNLAELSGRVTAAEGAIDAIEADYLKAADKEALQTAINNEVAAREGADNEIKASVKAISDDYLKAADKEELTQAIATAKQEAVATVLGEGVDADFDTLKEVADWILSDTTGAAALQTDVATLKTEMDAVEGRATTLEGEMDAVEAAVATKVEQEAYNTKVAELEAADSAMAGRLDAIETQLGDGEGSVSDQIANAAEGAKNAAIEAAAADATTKANTAEANAKAYTDTEVGKDRARLDALEADTHTHKNLELLETYTQTEANLADAVAKKHEHANKDVLDGIDSAKVSAWDAAEGNAKTYADGLNTAMTTKVDAIDGRVTQNTTDISTKASQEDLDKAEELIATNTANIASNTAAINSWTRITESEIEVLFQ